MSHGAVAVDTGNIAKLKIKGAGMLLVKKLNHHRVLSLLALALTAVQFTLPQAAVIAAMPGTTQAAIPVSESQHRIRQAFSSADQPFYLGPLATLYASRHMQPLWQDALAVQKFQQQLAEVALSGVQPQFTRWIERLTNPAITGFARDVALSDAMLGYLQFVSNVPTQGETWLYSNVPYRLTQPSVAVVNRSECGFG